MNSRFKWILYVGNLPVDVREREVEDLFCKYGPIVHIDLKIPSSPPCYAFVEFEEERDAEDGVRDCDGYVFNGHQLTVELTHCRDHSSSEERGRQDSMSPSSGRSRSSDKNYSPSRSYSRSRSHIKSPEPKSSRRSPAKSQSRYASRSRSHSASRSRSRSRSPLPPRQERSSSIPGKMQHQ